MKIVQKDATLFVRSEVSNEYESIKNAIVSNHKFPSLSENEFQCLTESDKEFLERRFYDILNKAQEEWQIELHDVENNTGITKCELCSQTPIKKISTIRNKINGTTLVIGSTCVNDFENITDRNGKNTKQLKKEGYIHKNEQKLLEIDKDILKDMDRFSKIQKERTLLTQYLNRECNRLKIEYHDCTRLLMQKSFNDANIAKITSSHKKIKQFLSNFDEFVSTSENSFFGINKKVDNWCLNNYSYDLVEDLSAKGEIDIYTISSIKEPSFLKKMIIGLKPLIEKNDMKLLSNFGNNRFNIIFNNHSNIIFELDSSKFIDRYKGYLFQKTNYIIGYNEIIKMGEINTHSSLNEALKIIYDGNNYAIKYSDTGINEIAFYNKPLKIYNAVPFKQFVNEFSEIIFNKGNYTQRIALIENYIKDKSTPYSVDEYKKHLKSLGIDYS